MIWKAIVCATFLFAVKLEIVAAEDIKTPQEQFAGYPTRIDDIPDDWATTNPILTRVCFNLKYPVNSPEADAFLRELHSTVSAMEFGVKVRIERTIYPVEHAYCVSLLFRNWEDNRLYENSEGFLRFYKERWQPTVTETAEQLTVLDQVAAGDD